MNFDRRLERLSRQLGCPIHGEPLQCPVCQPDEPIPPELTAAMSSLVDAIIARVGVEELRARCLPVPRQPPQAPCPRCAGRRDCPQCHTDYARAMFRACHMTAAEQSELDAVLALARRIDAQRARAGRSS
jgi:hypothetical protein